MEPANKRRKTVGALTETDEDDELFLDPEELNQKRDPSFLLAKGRADAARQLKSRFEDIFAKYERDFTGIGDEVDLETGEVVVDNGHLSSMKSMKDWIVEDDDEGDEDGDQGGDSDGYLDGDRVGIEDEETPREAEGQVHEQALPCGPDENRPDPADGGPRDPWQISEPDWPSGSSSTGPPLLGSLLPTQSHSEIQDQSLPPFVHESSGTADPTWQAPELPPSAFLNNVSVSNARSYGGATPVITRTVLKKSLKAPDSPEADDEDDLQTASVNAPESKKQREPQNTRVSPLINKSFPAVDSSPHDNDLKDLIQDVVASIPDTPPSIRLSRVPKAQGKPSPLNQEHQIHQRSESNLQFSSTPLRVDGRAPRKKRGTKPKVRVNPGETTQTTLREQADSSPWEESDLESFLDITGQGITKPAGQTLYVNIQRRKIREKDMVTADKVSDRHANGVGFGTHEGSPEELSTQRRKSSLTPDHQGQDVSITAKLGQSRKPHEPKPADKFERNVVDPAFAFSDEEILLPRRYKKEEKLQSKHSEPSTLPSPPLLDLNFPNRMGTEHHGTAVDRENITLAPDEAAGRMKARETETRRTDRTRVSDEPQPAQSLSSQPDPIQQRSQGRARATLPRRTKRSISDSNSEPLKGEPVAIEAALNTRISKEPQVITSDTDENNTKPKQQRRRSVRLSSNAGSGIVSATDQSEPLSSTATSVQNPPINADRDLHTGRQDSSNVTQETEQPVAKAGTRTPSVPKLPSGQSDLRKHQNLATAIPERSAPAGPQSTQPTTPSRPRAKQVEKNTPSFSTSVLSLLSDSDDDEDELSFNHSDFTPSGHHRILAHRPSPQLPTTPRFSASSKKKKRTDLLHSRSHSSRSHKISKPPRTPHSTGSDKAGAASHKRTHRKSHRLARSVVRVVRRLDGNEDREGSIFQTPGGSKRRCGEEGWKCERDFCFVCLE